MIVNMIRKDVLSTEAQHIIFAVNTEGFNDAGFAEQVSSRFWPELAMTGPKKMGDIMNHSIDGGRTFHAIVCHSLGQNGWDKTPQVVEKALNELVIPEGESVTVVLMGAGMVGQLGGVDVFATLGAMARCNKQVIVYTL